MLNTLILFAQAAEEEGKKGPADGFGGLFSSPIMPILIVMVLFFFLIILPAQRRQRKEQATVMSTLKKNDEVVTTAGIIGIVAHIKESGDEVTLKIDDNARIRVLKSTIVRILKKEESPKDPAAPTTTPAANTNIKPMT
jgi:preprotein translocase subunit YajC